MMGMRISDLGLRIRQAREGLGLTADEAAEQAGVVPMAWSWIERTGHCNQPTWPTVHSALRFFVAAGVSADRVITGEGGMGGPE